MSKSTACNICHGSLNNIFIKKVLNKYKVNYYQCSRCRFVQTEKPFWLKEAYNSAINDEDTGLVSRNITLSHIVTILAATYFKPTSKLLDYAGGYGLLTRLLRDIGLDCYWSDPYCKNILAIGFGESKKSTKYDCITCFEVLEHLEYPINDLKKLLKKTDTIICSTQLLPNDDKIDKWEYLGPKHGQHISLFSPESLQSLARALKVNVYSDGAMVHVLTKRTFSQFVVHNCIRFQAYLFPLAKLKFNSKTYRDHLKLKLK